MKHNALFVLLPILLLVSCRQEPSGAVATVAGLVITTAELEQALARRMNLSVRQSDAVETKREVLDELICQRVLLARAKAAGYHTDPELLRRFEQMIVAKYEQEQMPNPDLAPVPTPGEIAAYYREHAETFRDPEKLRVAMIRLHGSPKATLEKRAQLRQRGARLLALAREQVADRADFGDLARQHSDDRSTRYLGGDCGWIERSNTAFSWPQEVTAAMLALERAGDLSPVIEAGGDCYLLKLIDRNPDGIRPLEEVRDRISYLLTRQRREKAVELFHLSQRESVNVRINQDALAQVELPNPPTAKLARNRPPTLPGR